MGGDTGGARASGGMGGGKDGSTGRPIPTNGVDGFIAPDWVGRVEGEVFRRAVLGGAMGEGEWEGEGC